MATATSGHLIGAWIRHSGSKFIQQTMVQRGSLGSVVHRRQA